MPGDEGRGAREKDQDRPVAGRLEIQSGRGGHYSRSDLLQRGRRLLREDLFSQGLLDFGKDTWRRTGPGLGWLAFLDRKIRRATGGARVSSNGYRLSRMGTERRVCFHRGPARRLG